MSGRYREGEESISGEKGRQAVAGPNEKERKRREKKKGRREKTREEESRLESMARGSGG